MRETRNKGNFPGGSVMYGYRINNKKVVIHVDEAQIVRRIFTDYENGKSGSAIIDELNEQGVLYRNKPFAKTTFYRMIGNEKYAGIFRHGDEIFTNIYPAIISESLFETVKRKAAGNKYGKHKKDVCYLLKSILFCGYCGKRVCSDSGTSKSGKIMRYYRCTGKKDKSCSLNPIRKELIENIVIDALQEAFNKIDLDWLADKILERLKANLINRRFQRNR